MSTIFDERKRVITKEKLAENLKYLRNERGLSQRELAKNIGVGKSIVSDWEKCLHEPSLTNLAALALFFDTSPDELVGWSELKLLLETDD